MALRFIETWQRLPSFCYFAIRFGTRVGWKKTATLQAKLRSCSQHAALLTSMVELQKAQCFFMIAIQIAALIMIQRSASLIEVHSYQHLQNNMNLIRAITTAGILPVTFGLFTLHLSNMKSSFIYCLTAVTVSMSSATRLDIKNLKFNLKDMDAIKNYRFCGGNPSPETYCYNGTDPYLGLFGGGMAQKPDLLLLFNLLILVMLSFNQFPVIRCTASNGKVKWVSCFKWVKSRMRRIPGRKLLDKHEMWWYPRYEIVFRGFAGTFLLLGQLVYLFLFFMHGATLYNLTIRFLDIEDESKSDGGIMERISASNWNFGQVIAVTVLVPSLVEYAYLASRKYIFLYRSSFFANLTTIRWYHERLTI